MAAIRNSAPRWIVAVAVAAAFGLVGASSASAGVTPIVTPSSVPAGGQFTVSASGCYTYAAVGTQIPGVTAPSKVAYEGGIWTVTFVVPLETSPGTYGIHARCPLAFDYPGASITVTQAEPTTETSAVAPATDAIPTTTTTVVATTVEDAATVPPAIAVPSFTG